MREPVLDWQAALRNAYRDPLSLLRDLEIDPAQLDWLAPAQDGFAMRVPREFAARMQRGNPRDPLLLQVLPRQKESEVVPGYSSDPLNESQFQPQPGFVQKYAGRALLITTGACGVHCRYCFRREFPYAQSHAATDGWQDALASLRASPEIEEVILSGGDPLSLTDGKLERLIRALDEIPHLRRLRLHTRQAIVLPQRVTPGLIRMLSTSRLACVVVVHVNHAQELDTQVEKAMQSLRSAGVTLLNQSVLLAQVNDDAASLAALSLRLFECGVLPYYLHQLDAVNGAAHFAVADSVARGIMQDLNSRLSGYLVPRLVREIPGADGKLPIAWT